MRSGAIGSMLGKHMTANSSNSYSAYMHALPTSLVEHGLTTRFQTASLLKEATSGSSGDLISYIQPSRLQREENEISFQGRNWIFVGGCSKQRWHLCTATESSGFTKPTAESCGGRRHQDETLAREIFANPNPRNEQWSSGSPDGRRTRSTRTPWRRSSISGRRARALLQLLGMHAWQDRPLLAMVVVRVHGQVRGGQGRRLIAPASSDAGGWRISSRGGGGGWATAECGIWIGSDEQE
jgi:hypothetical protein